jgi:hypothetical protein
LAQTFKIIDGDFVENQATGRFSLISGRSKLSQDITEFFEVDIQPNGFGAGIEQLVGLVDESSMIISVADRQIRDGLRSFINLIRTNPAVQRQANERIIGISNIVISVDSTDQTKYYFSANIMTEGGTVSVSTLPT